MKLYLTSILPSSFTETPTQIDEEEGASGMEEPFEDPFDFEIVTNSGAEDEVANMYRLCVLERTTSGSPLQFHKALFAMVCTKANELVHRMATTIVGWIFIDASHNCAKTIVHVTTITFLFVSKRKERSRSDKV